MANELLNGHEAFVDMEMELHPLTGEPSLMYVDKPHFRPEIVKKSMAETMIGEDLDGLKMDLLNYYCSDPEVREERLQLHAALAGRPRL